MNQPLLSIPQPAPDFEGTFWSPPPAPICTGPGGACPWARLCSAPRQALNHAAGIFGPDCPNHQQLTRLRALGPATAMDWPPNA